MAMDEELAELTADDPEPSGPPRLPVSENTPEVQLLTRLIALNQAAIQQRSKKRINFPPLPRPFTARDVVRERRRMKWRERTGRIIAEAQARWTRIQDGTEPDDSTAPAEQTETPAQLID